MMRKRRSKNFKNQMIEIAEMNDDAASILKAVKARRCCCTGSCRDRCSIAYTG
jgi:hypothetical protein